MRQTGQEGPKLKPVDGSWLNLNHYEYEVGQFQWSEAFCRQIGNKTRKGTIQGDDKDEHRLLFRESWK